MNTSYVRLKLLLLATILTARTYGQSTNDGFNPNIRGNVSALALQTDGKIVIGGYFTAVEGTAHRYLARINPDGSIDDSFDPRPDGPVSCLAVQADGKILAGGRFSTLSDKPRRLIGRINPDGSLDESFNPGQTVRCLLASHISPASPCKPTGRSL